MGKWSLKIAQVSEAGREFDESPVDLAELEAIWGEPVPKHLLFIGGYDWYARAFVYRDPSDTPDIFQGEFCNQQYRYHGPFIYRHPEGKPASKIVLSEYDMYSSGKTNLLFRKRNMPPPVDYFELTPAVKSCVQRPSGTLAVKSCVPSLLQTL